MWASIVYILLIAGIVFFARRPQRAIPVFINGLIPSLPGAASKDESGTTVLIFFADEDPRDEASHVFMGYADDEGCISSSMPFSSVGRKVTVRVRHAAYVFQDLNLIVPRYGIIHTAKMELDGVYNGRIRGAGVGDLAAHYQNALTTADEFRINAVNLARRFGLSLARVPLVYWPLAYVLVIVANALDYFQNADQIQGGLDNFVHATYFSTVTITTLGYGDAFPLSDRLRIACSVEAVAGIFLIGLFLNSLFYERRT